MLDEIKNQREFSESRGRIRRLGLVVAGVGLGSALAYLIAKAFASKAPQRVRRFPDHVVDDRGTGQDEAVQILRKLRDRAFAASDEKLALALGRPVQEVVDWNAGQELIDDDVVMKARGIAMHRGVALD
jgi:hypothetical protein